MGAYLRAADVAHADLVAVIRFLDIGTRVSQGAR